MNFNTGRTYPLSSYTMYYYPWFNVIKTRFGNWIRLRLMVKW
jgi:hypothetical protein